MSGFSLRRSAFAVVALALLASPHGAPAARPVQSPSIGDAVAQRYYPEVRLRKMHLVRPDLIPYPISFEIYC